MTLARTSYVRERIAQTPWERRAEIEPLLMLERIVLGEMDRAGWVWNGYVRPQIIKAHHSDYLAILDELTPGWREEAWARWRRERDQERDRYLTASREAASRRRAEFEERVQTWRAAGHSFDVEPAYEPHPLEGLDLDELEAWHIARGIRPPWEPRWHPERPYA